MLELRHDLGWPLPVGCVCYKTTTRKEQRHKVKMKMSTKLNTITKQWRLSTRLVVILSMYLSILQIVCLAYSQQPYSDSQASSRKPFPSKELMKINPLIGASGVGNFKQTQRRSVDDDDHLARLSIEKSAPTSKKPRLIRRKWIVVASRWQNEVLLPCQIVDLDDEQTVSLKGSWRLKSSLGLVVYMR